MMVSVSRDFICQQFPSQGTIEGSFMIQIMRTKVVISPWYWYSNNRVSLFPRATGFTMLTTKKKLLSDVPVASISLVKCSCTSGGQLPPDSKHVEKIKKVGKREHHLWKKRDSAGSGQKALNLVRIISEVPDEKEAVYRALDKWTAWEVEFPVIAAAKAVRILRKRSQWRRLIQVAKWMLSKGQGTTMATYDSLLLAFDMVQRIDEAESLWNMILHTHTRSISKRLFSRMIALYDHHDMPRKIVEVFADMEELRVRPDEDTVRRVARAFLIIGQEEKQKLVLRRYQCKWKYVHFNGERVRVRRHVWDEN